ncbi:Uncharacterised protein [Mycobacterium tuberculosis]|nr:Uncharacterised protein [Mycobacterium tuberculosis]
MTDMPTKRVQRALDVLLERAVDALRASSGGGASELTLAEAGAALESVTDMADLLGQLLGPLVERVEQIREREMTERPGGASLNMAQWAVVHLTHGRDGLEIARHLLGQGRDDLLKVERGE